MNASSLAVAQAFLKAMEQLDYDRATALVAPDCSYTNPPPIGSTGTGWRISGWNCPSPGCLRFTMA